MSEDWLTKIVWRAAELRASLNALSTWGTEIANVDIPRLVREVERSRAEAARVTELLEGLTPGGTEFHDYPDRCAEFARDMMNGAAQQALLRKAAEAEVERLEQRNQLEAAVVAAALTLRRAENEKTFPAKMGWSEAWGRGVDTLGEATDALLAFNADAMANDAHTCQRDRSVL